MKSYIAGKTGIVAGFSSAVKNSSFGSRLGCPAHEGCPTGYAYDAARNICILIPPTPVMVMAGRIGKRW